MNKTIVYGGIVLVVIAFLVFITINGKKEDAPSVPAQNETMNQGVEITVEKEGAGEAVKAGDTVSVNYTGMLDNGTVFDSNVDPKFQHVEPFSFPVGAGQVIRGWDEGLLGMKVGEKRKLVISPEYGYGPTGIGPIPPNSTLIFEVELLEIEN